MEPSTIEYPFKIGNTVLVVDDTHDKTNNGLVGEVVGLDTSPVSDLNYKVKFKTTLNSGRDYEWFNEKEIVLDKNYVVRNILNDL